MTATSRYQVDDEMTFAVHIRRLTGRCFYQLRQLRTVRRTLTVEAARMFVLAFNIISRVDYCNSVFGSTNAFHLRPLQSVLNAAARLIVRKQKFDSITAFIRDELHWLPVLQNYHFKLCLLVYKCLRRSAPSYLIDQCVPGRKIWNQLPVDLRAPSLSLHLFTKNLKSVLFQRA